MQGRDVVQWVVQAGMVSYDVMVVSYGFINMDQTHPNAFQRSHPKSSLFHLSVTGSGETDKNGFGICGLRSRCSTIE